MNLIKIFHDSKVIYICLSICCSIFCVYGINNLIFESPTPFQIKVEGLVLDESKEYHFSNHSDIDKIPEAEAHNSVILKYQNGAKLLPKYLGTLHYRSDIGWSLKLSQAISTPTTSTNPYHPFCRRANQDKNGNFVFFGSESSITQSDLTDGLIVNFPSGTKRDRVTLSIVKVEDSYLLRYKDDALGINNKLPNRKLNISVNFNPAIKKLLAGNIAYVFDNTSPTSTSSYELEYKPKSFNKAILSIKKGSDLLEHLTIHNYKSFRVEDILFSISKNLKYGANTAWLFILHFISALGFITYLLSLKRGTHYFNPIQSSLIKIRIAMNCLLLLGIPFFIHTLSNYPNSIWYDTTLFLFPHILNLSFFIKNTSFNRDLGFGNWKLSDILKPLMRLSKSMAALLQKHNLFLFWSLNLIFFALIPLAMKYTNMISNERVFGTIPSLHFQKILIILAYIIFSSNLYLIAYRRRILSITGMKIFRFHFRLPLTKHIFILLFSGILSLVTKDYGSILFVLIAIVFIELTLKRFRLRILFRNILVFFIGVLTFNYLEVLNIRKLYRLVYSFFPPDATALSTYNIGDRQSISYIWMNMQEFTSKFQPGLFSDLKILDVSKSVAHSDYALHWSSLLGGHPFLLLLIITVSVLLLHLIFIFRITLLPMKIEDDQYLTLPQNKHTIILSFWIIITAIQFGYQVFSNNLLFGSILSGVPMPFISVGRGDYLFLLTLLVFMESIFFRFKFSRKIDRDDIKYVSSDRILRNSFNSVTGLLILIFLLFSVKIIQLQHFCDDQIQIAEMASNIEKSELSLIESESLSEADDREIITLGNTIVSDSELTNLSNKQKAALRTLQYFYFNKTPKKSDIHVPFEISQDYVGKKISWNNHFDMKEKIISGSKSPFGPVQKEKLLVNDKWTYKINNKYYTNLESTDNPDFNDLSAEINKKIEELIGEDQYGPHIKASFVVFDRAQKQNIVTAQYPLTTNKRIHYENYLCGSVKKPLLADAALSIDFQKYINFRYNRKDMDRWISRSIFDFSGALVNKICREDFSKFEDYLVAEYNMPFYSASFQSYSDRPNDLLTNDWRKLLANGGLQKYRLVDVVNWYDILYENTKEDTNKGTNLKRILNQPLRSRGTANLIGSYLSENGIATDDYIAKTGTLELNERNISSSILLANNEYVIGLNFYGDKIPENSSGKTAKYFLKSNVLPLLLEYDMLH